jgi:hypothetical protein
MESNEPDCGIARSICPIASCENYTKSIVGNIVHTGCKFKQQDSVRPCALYKKTPSGEEYKEKNQ